MYMFFFFKQYCFDCVVSWPKIDLISPTLYSQAIKKQFCTKREFDASYVTCWMSSAPPTNAAPHSWATFAWFASCGVKIHDSSLDIIKTSFRHLKFSSWKCWRKRADLGKNQNFVHIGLERMRKMQRAHKGVDLFLKVGGKKRRAQIRHFQQSNFIPRNLRERGCVSGLQVLQFSSWAKKRMLVVLWRGPGNIWGATYLTGMFSSRTKHWQVPRTKGGNAAMEDLC